MPRFENPSGRPNKTPNSTVLGYIYRRGSSNVVLTAPHAQGPSSDLFTGEIAYRAGERTEAHIFISTVSREKLDLNYPSKQARGAPFRLKLDELVQTLITKYEDVLLLDIHGMNKEDGPDIYLGTLAETTARIEVIHLIIEEFENEGFEAWLTEYFEPSLIGGDITASIGQLGETIDAVQIEINQHPRQMRNTRIIPALVRVINQWKKKYRPVWGTGAILRRITGATFPIKTKQDLMRYLGGADMPIRWAKGTHRTVEDIIERIEEKWFPVHSSKDLIRALKNTG